MIALSQLTDAQLVIIYQKNDDPKYFGELYQRYYTKLYHYCLGKVKDREDAYDITADTFVKLTTKVKGLKNPELFVAWLFKIANNACMDRFKERGKTSFVDTNDFFDLEDEGDNSLEEKVIKEEQLNALDQILGDLDFETKTLVLDKYFNNKSVDQLEREMGLSKSAVKMRLARGRNKIAELMMTNGRTRVTA
ncbi:MAG: RNA polymerase sigma factor [Saprospiraceae bacterium]